MACERCKKDVTEHKDGNCPDGGGSYTWVASPEVMEFIKANPDASPEQLTEMWIDRIRNKRRG